MLQKIKEEPSEKAPPSNALRLSKILIRQVPDEGALDGKPVVLFAYETQAEAKAGGRKSGPFRLKTRYFSRRGMCGAKRADASQFR